jgi:hypothetical protein
VLACSSCFTSDAAADGYAAKRHHQNVRHAHRHGCAYRDNCGLPVVCPSRICYSLYGAYPPYGGSAYWARYTYGGWGFR